MMYIVDGRCVLKTFYIKLIKSMTIKLSRRCLVNFHVQKINHLSGIVLKLKKKN